MTAIIDSWVLLVVTLPNSGATVRMRIWRAIKTIGSAALRDGAYLLPAGDEQIAQLRELADEARQEDGQAWLLNVRAANPEEEAAFRALFDRSADYAELQAALSEARKTLSGLNSVELNRLLRRHGRAYEAIRTIDFFPNEASTRAEAQWNDFSRAIETTQSPGEPHALTRTIARRDPAQYQGRLWATRRHLWVDRVASAWLIQRFIDPHARFSCGWTVRPNARTMRWASISTARPSHTWVSAFHLKCCYRASASNPTANSADSAPWFMRWTLAAFRSRKPAALKPCWAVHEGA
ncbi:protein of unknown function [Cupriavidus neocaledonicus]|uniref:Protein ChrB n=1 Tax=Cupriavidus neocaledonicus TaxID=1040979 RepID=A0A375H911_9BURK|nr:hypothetical protein CBM2605_B100370 [Cupriavidus neocaledonicus]SPD46739.1 protein of unknown function [Cupriavidus neocaledonicus]